MSRYGNRGLGIATGILGIVFAVAVGVVVGYVACYWWIWQGHGFPESWNNMLTKGVLLGIFSLFGLIGILYDLLIGLSGFCDIDIFTGESGMTKLGIAAGIIFGGVVPGIMLAIYTATMHTNPSYDSYSTDSSYGGSNGGNSSYSKKPKPQSGSTKKPKTVVGSTKKPKTTSGSTKKPVSKRTEIGSEVRFKNPGRPVKKG